MYPTTAEIAQINANWKVYDSYQLADHSHIRYKNTLVRYLWRVDCVVSYPSQYIRTAWLDMSTASYIQRSEDKFDRFMGGANFKINPPALDYIDDWREGLEPEPGPEPEPSPIDEGNGIMDGIMGDIQAWIKDAILAGLAFLEEPLNVIKDIIGKVGNAISTFASTMESAISTIMAKVTGLFEIIVGKIKGVIDDVWNNIQLIWETLKDVYDTIKTAIVTAFKTSWEFIKQTFTTLWDKMKTGLKWIANSIVEGIKFLWEKIKDGLNWAGTVLNTAYKALKETVTAIWERTKQRLTDTIESIKTGFGDAIDRLKDFFLWLWEQITAIFDKVFDMSEEAIEKMGYRVLTVQKRILERFIQAEGKV